MNTQLNETPEGYIMSEELSYEGFCEFVKQQSEIREINHRGTWENCAVGEYVNHVIGNRDWFECSRFANGPLLDNNPEVHDTLNARMPRTYGALADML